MNNNRKILAAFAVITLMVASAGLFLNAETKAQKDSLSSAKSGQNKPSEEITISYTSTTGQVYPHEIARELGYLKGVNLFYAGAVTGGPEGIVAVTSGSADIGRSAINAIINAKVRGAKIKGIVGVSGTTSEKFSKYMVLKNSSIKSAKDLAGKKFAVNVIGGQADYVMREYLARNGISREQVQLIVMPSAQHEMALKQGLVDIISAGDVVAERLTKQGDARVLFTDYELIGSQTSTVLFVSERFLKEKPEVARLIVDASAKAADWAREHPEEAKELAAKVLKDRGDSPEAAKNWNGFGVREHALIEDGDAQFWIDWMVKEGKIQEGELKPYNILTNEFNSYYKNK